MISQGSKRTNLGFLFLLVLASCVFNFDGPSFFVKAQVPAPTPANVVAAPTPAAECPLQCANGAECKLGEHNFDFFPTEANGAVFTFLQTTTREGWYCDCPVGWTGLRCNRQYEICPLSTNMDSSTDAHYCFHGGSCLTGLTDGTHDTIDESQRFCDCKNAEHNGTPYFGKYCEIEGAIRCSADSDEYCTSQGQCKEDFASKFTPCECRTGHRGPHCEFMRGSVPDCTLTCGARDDKDTTPIVGGVGECRLGIKEFENARYEDFWSGHDGNYQYCECPDGWFGDDCEIPGVECGGAHCFNGATCLEGLNANGKTTYTCDCRDADHLGFNWAGQYCENKATIDCNDPDDTTTQGANGHLFCTNGGTCKDPFNPHLGCNCPEGRFGHSCEFDKPEDATCSLKCQNGGQCKSGFKDNSFIQELGKSIEGYDTQHAELFEHCVCPNNFFGIQCEHKLEICPGGDHVCLHGSQCVVRNEGGSTGEVKYMCDCDAAFDSLEKYAGKFCQYSSTDICTKNGQPGMGKANFAFCVNNGQCKGKVNDGEDPPGCFCPEGFYGDHCEYLEVEEKDDDDSYTFEGDYTIPDIQGPPAAMNDLVFGLSAAVIVVVIAFIVVLLRALFKGPGSNAADIKNALSESESSAAATNTTGIINTNSGDASLEDIEVDDYVNNHTDKQMTNVQIV